MKYNVRIATDEDHAEVFQWFCSKKWPHPPIERIAPNHFFVAEKDGALFACAGLYLTGRSLAFIDWTAVNPEVAEKIGTQALIHVMKAVSDYAKAVRPPVRAVCFFTQNEKLAKVLTQVKFRKTDGYTRLFMTL